MDAYTDLLLRRSVSAPSRGIDQIPDLHPGMFGYQRDVTSFLLNAGSGAAFLDTGLGKSLVALEWGRIVAEETGKPVLMLAPLAVAPQHVREAHKFGLEAQVVRDQSEVLPGVNVTNYAKVEHFDPSTFGGVILDESSIVKNFTGSTSRKLISMFANTPFRLACTATPAPNDHMELGQHSQFLGVMPSNEMLSRWFIADQNNMGRYRLKGHAVKPFWNWVASWARCISKPSDLGYPDDGFILPRLNLHRHVVAADVSIGAEDMLFRIPETSATSIHREKRLTADQRAEKIADIVNAEKGEAWVIWCDTDYEADALVARVDDAVEVRGSMTDSMKEERLVDFSEGRSRVIVSKPSIAGFGLNWQHCARVAFVGLSFSYESFYQAVRRCWRFGQTREVECHIAMADTERNIWDVISRKSGDHEAMKTEMYAAMKRAHEIREIKIDYQPKQPLRLPAWIEERAA
ncbi:MAG: helicase [Mesorhizobium sp.]|uniref:helicase-related protein n=1 Tax=Mesorhizobium sp. TaxID=1871066 RepID=UPI00121271BE|nr:DEAD/DEAH box helicase [Mesorhizobium sp.]TIP70350.1 MAG: helicase [Mesorhizobium sp.]TIQ06747.1 MAG: helicase [Mesorhizobium sp.]TIR48612.1 MAG: helicase [Mesorhizobium sp.]TJV94699.1 MAG: helicase [Mesorhizobium sp.]